MKMVVYTEHGTFSTADQVATDEERSSFQDHMCQLAASGTHLSFQNAAGSLIILPTETLKRSVIVIQP